ncbi:Regulatory-associated protein of mTOR [Varanus komodoensis]|nr:Regulatory-associated protein of mTOR [Varanus komodoensis]
MDLDYHTDLSSLPCPFGPTARYKQSLDPTVDEVKKLCTSLRRNAKEERVLFHYNGHGVPRPTVNGEIWVFNKLSSNCLQFPEAIPLELSLRLLHSHLEFRLMTSAKLLLGRIPALSPSITVSMFGLDGTAPSVELFSPPSYNEDTFPPPLMNYTQYIPLSIYDLQTWMGSPSIFVYDCSNAGLIVKSFKQFALQREQELEAEETHFPQSRLMPIPANLPATLWPYATLILT